MKIRLLLIGGALLGFAAGAALAREPKLEAVTKVELPRYMGSWRVIACMDNKVERNFVDAVETYTLRDARTVGVNFQWREKSFDAPLKTHRFTGRVIKDGSNASWRMHLFPLFSASYVILDVAPDYSYVAVGHPSRKFGWILARQKTIPGEINRELMRVFKAQGFDTTKFIKVPQEPPRRTATATTAPTGRKVAR